MNSTKTSTTNLAGSKYISSFLIVISLVLGISIGLLVAFLLNKFTENTAQRKAEVSTFYDSEYLNEIYNKFLEDYIGEIPSKEEMTHGIVKGLISSLNDPYTYFLNPDESKEYLESRSPDFEGIGVTLRFRDSNTEVESVLAGYPAEENGIMSGDVIVKVDGESTEGLQPSVVASRIRGKKDTKVTLEVYRPEDSKILSFTITRETINVDNVGYQNLGNGIYKINIVQFIDDSVESFNKSWDKVVSDVTKNNDVKGIIVDLRNNPGGYVSGVRYVLEDFLKENQVMMFEETKDTGRLEFKDYRKGRLEDVPVIVLVNEGSASASEIFAAAVQDNNRGKVIGMPTVGKGVEQQLISNLPDNSILIMVFQKWLTPSGRNINKDNPIKPDIEIGYTLEDYKKGMDTQLNKALEIIK